MKRQVLFGIQSQLKDEKIILKAVNEYLAKFDRTTSTVKKGSQMDAKKPYVLKQFHWNLNKDTGTYFELFSNQDLENRFFAKNHQDCALLIRVAFNYDLPGYEKSKSEKFITDMLASLDFETQLLAESDDREAMKGDAVQ